MATLIYNRSIMAWKIKHKEDCWRRIASLCSPDEVPTLLLISGGSSLRVMYDLSMSVDISLSHVTIGFVDERFDSAHSNFAELMTMFPDAMPALASRGAKWIDTRPKKQNEREMAEWYETTLLSFASHRWIILLGMGVDGHIAGIFPDEEDVFRSRFVATTRWVVGYESHNRFPKRFTLTFPALSRAEMLLAYIAGKEKKDTLRTALFDDLPLHQCPASFFKKTPQPCEIYTDIVV